MKGRGGLTALLLTAAGAALLSQPVAADAADDRVVLEIADCAGAAGETVRGIVALEVAPRTVLPVGSVEPAATRGVLECEDGVARIRVEESGRPEPLRLDIALAEHAAAARPRLLALALAELIATSRLGRPQPTAAEAEQQPEAAVVLQPAEAETVEASAGAGEPSFQLWLGVAAVREAEPVVLAPSVALGAVLGWDWIAIALDLRYERGRRTDPAVELGLDVGSIGLGPAWRVHGRSYQLLIGPAVRLGYAALRGVARRAENEGDSIDGVWFGPCAQTALQLRIGGSWGLRVGAELGYVARGVRGLDALGETLFDLGGVWLSAQVGVSFDVYGSAP